MILNAVGWLIKGNTMKFKEGRDFVVFDDCSASVDPDGNVKIWNMCETFTLSKKEFQQLTKFVEKSKSFKDADRNVIHTQTFDLGEK